MAEAANDALIARLRDENAQLRAQLDACAKIEEPRGLALAASSGDLLADEQDTLHEATTVIVVIGASGDLAKKKTFPALFKLFKLDLLPQHTRIVGYARSELARDEFRKRIGQTFRDEPRASEFLDLCSYHRGQYDNADDFKSAHAAVSALEDEMRDGQKRHANRLFYLAIPPSVFAVVANNIRSHLFVGKGAGWNRLVIEKPFGEDLETFLDLSNDLSMFTENEVYRIDHYLGKEMVQNLMVLRFANSFLQPVWNRHHIASVTITFKEPFDVQGRGGYFDSFGIIRDVMQNHLLQIFSLVAMEDPVSLSAEDVRDEKTKVLRATKPIQLEDVVIGQYGGKEGQEAYREHSDVPDDSRTPTYAAAVLHIENDRWRGVPFFIKCGKALNERKAEIRIQFQDPLKLFGDMNRNELVLRVQPDEAIYLKTNSKVPGLETKIQMRELDFTYAESFPQDKIPDAYERLIYDVLRGDHNLFVRDDELLASWKIFTPLLHELEAKKIEPVTYEFGSRGPALADDLLRKYGFVYGSNYEWQGGAKAKM